LYVMNPEAPYNTTSKYHSDKRYTEANLASTDQQLLRSPIQLFERPCCQPQER
jgi:hypothetical protein